MIDDAEVLADVVGLVVAAVTPPRSDADPWILEFHDGSGVAFYFPARWVPVARAALVSQSALLDGEPEVGP